MVAQRFMSKSLCRGSVNVLSAQLTTICGRSNHAKHLKARWFTSSPRRLSWLESLNDGRQVSLTGRQVGRGVIEVSGVDACKLLQGLTTNDVTQLAVGTAARTPIMYTGFLTAKGRLITEAFVTVATDAETGAGGPTRLFVDVPVETTGALLRHLKMYKLRSKVVVKDRSEDLRVWALLPGAKGQEFSVEGMGQGGVWAGGEDPRFKGMGLRVIGPVDKGEPGTQVPQGDHYDYEVARTLMGLGESTELVDRIPSECNLDLTHGVSFNKGCYVGQELTARTQFKGVVRKRLLPFRTAAFQADRPAAAVVKDENPWATVQSDPPEACVFSWGAEVVDVQSGKKVGEIIDFATVGVGLALLRLEEVLAANPPLKLVSRRRQEEGQAPSSSDPELELRPYLPPWWPATFDLKTGKPRA